MQTVDLLKRQAAFAYDELLKALDGVTEPQAWAVLPAAGSEYLHTDGSIQGLVLHIATGKRLYASMAFRNREVRWRDTAEQLDRFEPSWPAALEYLTESQRYWLASWEGLTDGELEKEMGTIWDRLWPAWRIIHEMNHHDSYHAGQIVMLRYASGESSIPPPSYASDIRESAASYPSW
ncbi:MAG: DinB family protein [Fimbriimonas ginsengisoli]|uniref:DinB family protein n=1 Tax=Fimbriimonas ginsengisoli TaxID=1005039 RepID=A0A931PTP7_FIMGI|nr:DinB family protein [Fimbriimonas ginsengisoli]